MAFSTLEELATECREIVDNASEGLSQTQRIQTLDETANQLESINEPDVTDVIGQARVKWTEMTKSRGISRATRCSNAVAALQAVVAWCEESLEAESHPPAGDTSAWKKRDDTETLRDECQQMIDEAEGCEFPGMYG